MDFDLLVEGPLLRIAFSIFVVGVIVRWALSCWALLRSRDRRNLQWKNRLAAVARTFMPLHRALVRRPVYSALRYIFHLCLVVVPLWLSGHIALWEGSRFELSWAPLPDEWMEWMSILVLGLALVFLMRRIMFKDVRLNSSRSDYILIGITVMPFMTGLFLTHGTLDSVYILGDNMRTIHVLSGEAMLVAVAFLFCRARLRVEKCMGCAACDLNCPTGALESSDTGTMRFFAYVHYRCVCCGACVATCPERATELRHEISLGGFFEGLGKRRIGSVALEVCETCGTPFAPEPQLNRISETLTGDCLHLCPVCRRMRVAGVVHQRPSWIHPSAQRGPEWDERPPSQMFST